MIKIPHSFVPFLITAFVLLCLFILSLWVFLASVPSLPSDESKAENAWHDGEKQTAIILTGSRDRLEAGMQLLRQKDIDSLFISGVYPKLKLSELFHVLQESPETCGAENLSKNCIELGKKATNTRQNACESLQWLQNNNVKRFYLITSDYHYPRSYAEFAAILRQNDYEAVILPHITHGTDSHFGSFKDWSGEYLKWLIVKSRIFLESFLPKASIMNCFQ